MFCQEYRAEEQVEMPIDDSGTKEEAVQAVHKCLLGRAPQYLCSKFATSESLCLHMTISSNNINFT